MEERTLHLLNDSNNTDASVYNDDYETKRTINEVLDKETGEVINSEDFFKKPESEIIQYRRRLAEAIAGYANPKFVCAYCGQLLKLSGKQTRRGQVSFFAHLHDSDDCEIKTNGEFSKEEIEIRKYGNIRESQRHIDLKNEIANALNGANSQEIGIKNVEIEKRITSDVPYLYWRQPDIFAEFGNKNIVFELQLSTTFLSAIVDRDIFYRLHNTHIIWIFNFSDNQEYVNLGNLMCKDICYSNKRNAFVFDDTARKLSKEEGQLVLLCIWFEPFIENGRFYPEKSIRKQEYIRMSDLKFDDEIFKPYYIDADSMFFKYQPELKINRINLEELNINRIRRTEKRRLDKEYLLKKKEDKINEIKEQIKKGTAKLQLFQKKDKFGFECNGITIIEPIYSEAIELSENGYIKVQKSKKYGLFNYFGEIVLDCDYKELMFVFDNKCIINRKNEWYFLDIQSKNETFIHKSKDKDSTVRLEELSEVAFIVRIEDTIGIIHNKYEFRRYDSISNFNNDGLAIAKRGGWWQRGSSTRDSDGYWNLWNLTPKKYNEGTTVYIEKTGEELISNAIEIKDGFFKGTKFGKWGIETKEKKNILSFEYDEIDDFIDGKAKARKNGEYGYIDEQGNTIIPFVYSEILPFVDGKARARRNGCWGTVDEQGDVIIAFEYNKIGEFVSGKAIASKGDCHNQKNGCINEQGDIIIPFEYDEIYDFINGKAKARKNQQYGFINEQGDVVIPFVFYMIDAFVYGKARAYKNGEWGIIDELGNGLIDIVIELENGFIKGKIFGKWGIESKEKETIISFEYDEIGNFIDGKAKARKNGKYGYIDEHGNSLVPFLFDEIGSFTNGRACAKKDGRSGIIDETGNGLFIFRKNNYSLGRYGERIENCKFGICNTNNHVITPAIYDKIEEFRNGKAKAYRDKKYVGGGKWSPKYSYKVGYIDEKGDVVIPFVFDEIGNFIDGRAEAKKGNKIIFIDEQGNDIGISSLKINSIQKGKITNIVDYGLFIVLECDVTALLHISELKKHNKICANFDVGDDIDVKILNIDKVRNRISLTLF